jgi:hypothetical protein
MNPKDAIGSTKLPLHLWPETATALGCLGLLDGALKYGRSNFREAGIRSSVYFDAARRHLNAWFEGEDLDPDSGLPHLAHVLATVAIVVDAQAAGKLQDDRQTAGGYRATVNALTPHVARLKALHADKHPKHYTIADVPAKASIEPLNAQVPDLSEKPFAAKVEPQPLPLISPLIGPAGPPDDELE